MLITVALTLISMLGVSDYPPVPPASDARQMGVGIQRTMTLLATSTPRHRNKVKILFYGQSITEQEWTKQVADDLRTRFPDADIEIENRAIGGFSSQRLIRPTEHDVIPFYPDLLIFHVYGGNGEYEQIIKSVRSRTTAEVLMQLDHVAAKWPQTQPDEQADKGLWWDWMMNHQFLPEIARKYGCAVVDVRTPWLAYLKTNHYEPRQLLKDDVHLNDQGNFVMASLIKQFLVYRPELTDRSDGLMTLIDKPLIDSNKLEISFDGNRIDAIMGPGTGRSQVLIDGKRPSEIPECYAILRPAPGPFSPLWISRVNHDTPFDAEEQWTLTVKSFALNGAPAGIGWEPDAARWTFEVSGSNTGPDGEGQNDRPFVSKSGKVKIDPNAWLRNGNVPAGFQIKWKVTLMGTDVLSGVQSSDSTRESVVTIAQGLPNGRHTLTVIGDAPVTALRVYRPPIKAD